MSFSFRDTQQVELVGTTPGCWDAQSRALNYPHLQLQTVKTWKCPAVCKNGPWCKYTQKSLTQTSHFKWCLLGNMAIFEWRQGEDPLTGSSAQMHQPVSFICFISVARSIARSFNRQEITKSLLRHILKSDSPRISGWETLSGAADSCKVAVSSYPSRNIRNFQVP